MTSDNLNIITFADRIVGRLLTRNELFGHVLDELGTISENADVGALMTALDSDYPHLHDRYNAGERGEVAISLQCLREEMFFNLGVALGKRLR